MIREAYRRIRFMADLSDDELDQVAAKCQERSFANGETILTEGERGPGLFMLSRAAPRC